MRNLFLNALQLVPNVAQTIKHNRRRERERRRGCKREQHRVAWALPYKFWHSF